jgi:hypothetical protein
MLPEGGVFVEDGEEYLFDCFSCGRRKAYFNPHKGTGVCFYCGRTYRWRDFPSEKREPVRIHLPVSFKGRNGKTFRPACSSIHAIIFLRKRKVEPEEFPSILTDGEGLLFPVFNSRNLSTGYMYRSWSGSWISKVPNKSEYFFALGTDHFSGKTMVLVEGIFDVLTPRLRYGLALLGTKLSDAQLHFIRHARPGEVVIWFDPDGAGKDGAEVVHRKLLSCGLRSRVFYHDREPGDCGPEEVPYEWRF